MIGMLSSMIPESRELYVPREIAALRAAGHAVRIYSIFTPNRDIRQPDLEPYRHEAFLGCPWSPATWGYALLRVLRHPLVTIGLLFELLRAGWRSPEQLLKTLVLFPAACRFANDACKSGVTQIHAQWANVSSTVGYVVARLAEVPFTFSIHGEPIFLPRPCGLLALKCRKAMWVASCNAAAVDYVVGHGLIAPDRIAVIHHGVDTARFFPSPHQRSNDAPFRMVAVGRLERSKGLPILMGAMALLHGEGRRVHLEIIGSGPLEALVRETIRNLALDSVVTLTPYLAQTELPDRYRAADALVLPAVIEHHWGIPNTVLEAMACGVPVVATELPSMKGFFIPDKTFLPTRDGDPASVAAQIVRLMDTPALATTLATEGPCFIHEHFDWATNLAAFTARFPRD